MPGIVDLLRDMKPGWSETTKVLAADTATHLVNYIIEHRTPDFNKHDITPEEASSSADASPGTKGITSDLENSSVYTFM